MLIFSGVHIFYFYIMYYPFYIFVLQGPGSIDELIFYTRGPDQSGRIRGSSLTSWLHHLALGLHRRPVGCTSWHSDFIADQLVAPAGTWTSSLTSWLHHLALELHRRPVSCTSWHSNFIAIQLVAPPGTQTSSSTSWLHHLALGLRR